MGNLHEPLVVDHDVAAGPLKRCQISGSRRLDLVIDLGHQPPCAALRTRETLDAPEVSYPLRLMHCPESGLAQLDYVVPGEQLYPAAYPYRAGISSPVVEAQDALAANLAGRFGPLDGRLIVDIGSNDGTLLAAFARRGGTVLGVEPTGIAQIARDENHVPTLQAFFTQALARDIAKDRGRARLITMTHVFAHMAPLGEVMRGVLELLASDGVLVIENHYLLALQEKNQFDSIYHEHLRTYSLKALCVLFGQYGLEVFDAERADRYGGNIRAYVARRGTCQVTPNVCWILQEEDRVGLHDPASWAAFRSRVLEQRDHCMEFLHRACREGASVAGVSAPGRATPLINFYGITPDLVPYLGELPTSLKLGQFVPGKHLPIVENRRLLEEQPDYLLLFSWHYGDFIAKRLRNEGLRGRMVVPLPKFKVLDA